jgi:hypothetical protein
MLVLIKIATVQECDATMLTGDQTAGYTKIKVVTVLILPIDILPKRMPGM